MKYNLLSQIIKIIHEREQHTHTHRHTHTHTHTHTHKHTQTPHILKLLLFQCETTKDDSIIKIRNVMNFLQVQSAFYTRILKGH